MVGLPPFEIAVDQEAGVIRTVLRGLWTMEDVTAFSAGMFAAVQEIAARHPAFGMISDSTLFQVQRADVSEEFARLAAEGNRGRSGPTAIVVGSMLNKFQAKRMFPDPRVHVFTEHEAAQRWLDKELAAARAIA
jgi:hypothetical protein